MLSLMVPHLCLRIIPRTLDMVGVDTFIRILFQSLSVLICPIDESIVVELKFSRKIYFLLFCIVLLLSTMVSCKKIEIYTLMLCSG